MKRYLALTAVMAAIGGPAAAQQMMAPAPMAVPMMLDAQTYRTMAMVSDSFEIESSRMALERSRNPRIRNFANMMVRDHSMTSQALMGGMQMAAMGGMAPASTSGTRRC